MDDTHLDIQLDSALRELPRERASSDFTAQVLARLERRPWWARGDARPWLAPALACALLLTLGLGFWQDSRERAASRARLERLRSEQRALAVELASLERLAAQARPVLYLDGGDAERTDVVLDLVRVAAFSPSNQQLDRAGLAHDGGLPR